MGDPKKRRKLYETPRKKWDKQLLESEKKLVEFYGLKNKKDLRKHATWLRNKRSIARRVLAYELEERQVREKELISGLSKIGLVRQDATLDEVLSLKLESLLERRLQTQVLRRGLANTSKQARQFIVHGHIGIKGKRINAPSYLVPVDESSEINWYKEPLQIEVKPKKDLKKEFEEAKGEIAEEPLIEEAIITADNEVIVEKPKEKKKIEEAEAEGI